jgi:multidrug efflux pump
MTSFAFILGVAPLLLATGAGAEMRRPLGTAVFSGMLGVTLFGIFLTPVFFYVIEGLAESSWFSSRRAHQIGRVLRILLGIVTLGLPWLLAELLRREHPRFGAEHAGRTRQATVGADGMTGPLGPPDRLDGNGAVGNNQPVDHSAEVGQ